MKYLFAHMCNLLSNDGKRVDKNTIWFDALMMLSLGTLGWFGTGAATIYFLIFDEKPPGHEGGAVILFAVLSSVFYLLLVRNKKYLEIWQKYDGETPGENRRGKIISLLFFFVPIVTTMTMALVWHNKI